MECYYCLENDAHLVGSKDDINIAICDNCGHMFVHPLPNEEIYKTLYKSDSYHIEMQKIVNHVSYYERFEHDYEIAKTRFTTINNLYFYIKERK